MSHLDPVQIAALDFARGKPGVGWFLEQGLGKTLCALTEYGWYNGLGQADKMVVVCPNTFKQGWVDEMDKHGFQFVHHVFRSAKKDEALRFFNRHHNAPPILIINYEALRMMPVLTAIVRWAAVGKTYFAIDESIQIKTYDSKQTKSVHRLAAVCRWVRLLTGKPQSQGAHDLWGQLRAIGLFTDRNFFAFRGLFCEMGGWENKIVVATKNADLLAAYMKPVVFQAKKKDWLPDLPRKDFTIRDYTMSEEQQRQYNQMERQFLVEIEEGYVTVDVAIAKYAKLAQIQAGFVYDEQGDTHELVPSHANPRLNLIRQLLEEEIEGKTCIVYRHRAVLDILLQTLAEYDPAWIKGQMKPDEVEEQKRRFNTDPSCRIILLQAEAARYGHTLIPTDGSHCRTMVFYENSYSLDTRSQLEDRIHRRGQTGENVLYIDLSGSSLDRRIIKALQRKTRLYEAIFNRVREATPT